VTAEGKQTISNSRAVASGTVGETPATLIKTKTRRQNECYKTKRHDGSDEPEKIRDSLDLHLRQKLAQGIFWALRQKLAPIWLAHRLRTGLTECHWGLLPLEKRNLTWDFCVQIIFQKILGLMFVLKDVFFIEAGTSFEIVVSCTGDKRLNSYGS